MAMDPDSRTRASSTHRRPSPHRRASLALAGALAALLLVAGTARGEEPVKVTAALDASTAAPGESVLVRFHVEVPKGQHVYPPGSQDGQALEAHLGGEVPGVKPGVLRSASEPRLVDVPGLGKVAILEGSFDLAWTLDVAKEAGAGRRELKGTFVYQACNEKVCFQPREVPFSLGLEVTPPLVPVGPAIDLPAPKSAHAGFTVVPDRARPGELVQVHADVFLKKGFHVYAPGSQGGQPTTVELSLPSGFTLEGGLQAPPPTREADDPDLKEHVKLYEGHVRLSQAVRVPAGAAPGPVTIKAKAAWLVCDERSCEPGGDHEDLAFTVLAAGGAPSGSASPPSPGPASPIDAARAPRPSPADATAGAARPPAADAKAAGAGSLIVTSILAGLAMLLLPCTYPMIPITISIFSKGKKLGPGQAVPRALAYAAGIVISFTLIGGVVQALLGAQGQNVVRSIATNGYLNLVVAVLFVYFALSFFGYYEVELPAFLQDLVDRGLKRARSAPGQEGGGIPTFGLFLMGSFFVLTSYTCGAPIVLGVLAVGASVPGKATVIAATAIFGLTIAIPFFVLALVPGALKQLPRGGSWFHTFKVALGTVELAASLKFLSNADIYWRAGILTRPVFLSLWVMAAAFLFLYVAGVLRLSHDEPPEAATTRQRLRSLAAGAPFLLLAIFFGCGLNGPLPARPASLAGAVANLEAFLPPDPYPSDAPAPGNAGEPSHARGHLPAYPGYDDALAAAKRSGKPLFLEFTGHT